MLALEASTMLLSSSFAPIQKIQLQMELGVKCYYPKCKHKMMFKSFVQFARHLKYMP